MRNFWSTGDLRARGRSKHAISAAAAAGVIEPVRTGWFSVPGTGQELVRAVRVGGVATAHSASRARGLWTPPDAEGAAFRRVPARRPEPILRVAVPSTTARAKLRDPDDPHRALGDRSDVIAYWTAPDIVRAGRPTGVVGVLVMLRDLFRTEAPERALAVVDSALRNRYLRRSDLDALAALLPAHLRPVVAEADARAESGTETIARYLLRLAGLRVEPQIRIAGLGSVDLLVEGRLIVELDGREWHDEDEAFAEDRRRDLVAAQGRYRTLRFTWFQVLFLWAEVESAVFAALAA